MSMTFTSHHIVTVMFPEAHSIAEELGIGRVQLNVKTVHFSGSVIKDNYRSPDDVPNNILVERGFKWRGFKVMFAGHKSDYWTFHNLLLQKCEKDCMKYFVHDRIWVSVDLATLADEGWKRNL